MTAHVWCWSDIVNPKAVEAAMDEEKRRARRPERAASNDRVADKREAGPPVAA